MGFKEGHFPPVEPTAFLNEPLRERIRTLAVHWGEYGFGTARNINVIYILKILFLYILGGVSIATAGVAAFWEITLWWNVPIVYQKLIIWTVLLESLNLAGSWGPLAGKFKPMMGGILYWGRTGTIRMRPWKWVPGTSGNFRTGVDVGLYYAFVLSLVVALALPGVPNEQVAAWADSGSVPFLSDGPASRALVNTAPVIVASVLWVLIGLRDKIVFLAARAEQYLPAFVCFSVLPVVGTFADMIIALKMLLVVSWVGAAFSKLGRHFTLVIPPMLSNTPFWAPRVLKRAMYRSYPEDLRPSKLASLTAHGPGTVVEWVAPLVLLFSLNHSLTLAASLLMIAFCIFIISTFPLAVPLEWNVLFAFAGFALFLGFPAQDGFAVTDFSSPWILVAVLVALLFFPVLGNVRPDKVSFLPSMRQYAGNWATAMFAFAPGAEQKLNAVKRPASGQLEQLQALGYPYEAAEITMQQTIAWRAMQSQGKGLFSVFYKYLPDLESRTVREGEFLCNVMTGFNFGDGHMHGPFILPALQERCHFAPGELIVAYVESEPVFSGRQHWQLVDAATGVLAEGSWDVAEMVDQQPWLPDGPIELPETFARPASEWPQFRVGAKADFQTQPPSPDRGPHPVPTQPQHAAGRRSG